jgi:methyl coenzyme M reductase subunit D
VKESSFGKKKQSVMHLVGDSLNNLKDEMIGLTDQNARLSERASKIKK